MEKFGCADFVSNPGAEYSIYDNYIRLITRVSVRYGEILHEPKASEISRNISQLTSVISDLFLQCTTYVTTNKSKECL